MIPKKKPYRFWIVQSLLLLPLALPIGSVGDKPVDLVFSDLLLPVAFFYCLYLILSGGYIARKHAWIVSLSALAIFYFLINPMIGALGSTDGFVRLLSALRFLKHFFFVFVAYMVWRVCKPTIEETFSIGAKVSICIVAILLFSDIFLNPGFPSSRWGGIFLGMTVYGFPNSPAVFYAFYLMFFLCAAQMTRNSIYLLLFFCALLIIFFSFSRAAWVTALLLVFFISVTTKLFSGRMALITAISLAVASIGFVTYIDEIVKIAEPWMYKIDTLSGKNVTLSGREGIWDLAVSLIVQKPWFGYMFEPFSNYNMVYDTPHQQYLEVTYKSGLVGLLVFVGFYAVFAFGLARKGFFSRGRRDERVPITCLLALLLAIFASNFVQPSVSYSVLGNALVFYLSLSYFVITTEQVGAKRGNELLPSAGSSSVN